jgi:diacylglycerol kinase
MKTFFAACRGVRIIFHKELHFRFHVLCACLVFVCGWWLRLSAVEWAIIVWTVAGICALEGINAVVEVYTDMLYPRFDSQAGMVKDMMAGVVFMGAIAAVIVGLCIFGPKIIAHTTAL